MNLLLQKETDDRIGIDGHLSHKTADGRNVEEDCNFPTHAEAFERLVQALTTGDAAVISNMDEVSAVGHRVVQGAEIFTKTTLVTDEVIDEIENLRDWLRFTTRVMHWLSGHAENHAAYSAGC